MNINETIPKKKNGEPDTSGYLWSVVSSDMDTREEGKEFDYEFLNGICEKAEKRYMEEYAQLNSEIKLVCEKHMKELMKKYKVL